MCTTSGYFLNMPSAKALPVEQLDRKTGEVVATHDSVYAAAEALNIPGAAGNINRVANGKAKSAYGFGWRYRTCNQNLDGEEWRSFEDVEVSSHGRVRRTTASGASYVTKCHNRVMINYKQWPIKELIAHVFADAHTRDSSDNPSTRKRVAELAEERGRQRFKRAVQQRTPDGTLVQTFDSVADAARATGIDSSYIAKCARGVFDQACGYKFSYVAPCE